MNEGRNVVAPTPLHSIYFFCTGVPVLIQISSLFQMLYELIQWFFWITYLNILYTGTLKTHIHTQTQRSYREQSGLFEDCVNIPQQYPLCLVLLVELNIIPSLVHPPLSKRSSIQVAKMSWSVKPNIANIARRETHTSLAGACTAAGWNKDHFDSARWNLL